MFPSSRQKKRNIISQVRIGRDTSTASVRDLLIKQKQKTLSTFAIKKKKNDYNHVRCYDWLRSETGPPPLGNPTLSVSKSALPFSELLSKREAEPFNGIFDKRRSLVTIKRLDEIPQIG